MAPRRAGVAYCTAVGVGHSLAAVGVVHSRLAVVGDSLAHHKTGGPDLCYRISAHHIHGHHSLEPVELFGGKG